MNSSIVWYAMWSVIQALTLTAVQLDWHRSLSTDNRLLLSILCQCNYPPCPNLIDGDLIPICDWHPWSSLKTMSIRHFKNNKGCLCWQSPGFRHERWAPSQYPKRRLFVRSRKVSKPRDLYLELSDRSEIWQALRQQCCRCACQISKRYDNLEYRSRGFETLRDLTERRLFGYCFRCNVMSSYGLLLTSP